MRGEENLANVLTQYILQLHVGYAETAIWGPRFLKVVPA